MINIKSYIEYFAEVMSIVNKTSKYHIDNMCAAVSEAHMIKKLTDAKGITLCVSYPDARGVGEADCLNETQQGFVFIVQKVAPGSDSKTSEVERYAVLQAVALEVRDVLLNSACDCVDLRLDNNYKIEWEWQIFGGFNGLSIGFNFKNND